MAIQKIGHSRLHYIHVSDNHAVILRSKKCYLIEILSMLILLCCGLFVNILEILCVVVAFIYIKYPLCNYCKLYCFVYNHALLNIILFLYNVMICLSNKTYKYFGISHCFSSYHLLTTFFYNLVT